MRHRIKMGVLAGVMAVSVTMGVMTAQPAQADLFESGSYRIDGVFGNSFGGTGDSNSFRMYASGGESIIGDGSNSTFVVGSGLISRFANVFRMQADSAAPLGTITPGQSKQTDITLTIHSSYSGGYGISTSQNGNLQNGSATVPAVSGSIASPVTWNEGSTKGLGFSMVSANPTTLPTKWGSGSAFAAFPGSANQFYLRTGSNGSNPDTYRLRIRADTPPSQQIGNYSNTITWSATTTP